MDTTKQGTKYEIPMPGELVEILKWHVGQLAGKMADSDLLFPSGTGGFRSAKELDKPFRTVAKEMGLGHPLTPRARRRTYQDVMRRARVHDTVTRAISGRASAAMQQHRSTASHDEQREPIGKLLSLNEARAVREGAAQVVSEWWGTGPGPRRRTGGSRLTPP